MEKFGIGNGKKLGQEVEKKVRASLPEVRIN